MQLLVRLLVLLLLPIQGQALLKSKDLMRYSDDLLRWSLEFPQ